MAETRATRFLAASRAARSLLAVALLWAPEGLLALDVARPVELFSIRNWHAEEGFNFGRARTLLQTRDGYLWVGTYEGLVRFDGVRFVEFAPFDVPELKNSVVTALCEDGDGVLWVGTQGGLTLRKGGRWQLPPDPGALPSSRVNALLRAPDGVLWIATDGGIAVARGGRLARVPLPAGDLGEEVTALAPSPEGGVLFGTPKGIGRVSPLGVEVLLRRVAEDSVEVTALHQEEDGGILFGMKSRPGLGRLVRGRVEVWGQERGLPNAIVSALRRDRNGGLWIATLGGGLCRKTGERIEVLDARHGLPSEHLQALAEDREGGLWAATYLGILRISEAPVQAYGARHGLPSGVRCVFPEAGGVVWIGTSSGIYLLRDGRLSRVALEKEEVRSFRRVRGGELWVGTRRGLFALGEGPRGPLTARTVVEGITVCDIAEDQGGRVWVTTNGQGVHVLRGGQVEAVLGTAEGVSSKRTGPVLVTPSGDVWIGTFGAGLNLVRGSKVTVFGEKEGIPPVSLMCLHADGTGALWIGTASAALLRMRNGRLARVTPEAGLPSPTIYGMTEDARGRLWFNSNVGVFSAFLEDLHAVADGSERELAADVFDLKDGLPSAKCIAGSQPICARGPDGRLWFAKDRGLAFVESAGRRSPAPLPPHLIEEVRSRDARLPGGPRVELPLGARDLEVRYTTPSFEAPDNVRFRYFLDGYDTGWVEAGTRRTAFYTGLPPGSYTFRVVASRGDGTWDEDGAKLAVVIPPRLTETRAFRAVLALALAGAVAAGASLVYRARLSALAQKQRSLERLVETRTHELSVANEQLARLNGEKDELLGTVAHELKNPLAVIRGYVEMLAGASELPRRQQMVMLEKIDRSAARMYEMARNLLDVNALQRGSVQAEVQPVDLVPLVEEVFETTRARAGAKGQELVLDAPADVPRALSDPRVVAEILDNLVSNALKYSPAGTTVRVRLVAQAKTVDVEVVDQGPGLTEEDRRLLFQPFSKLSARPTGGEHSTGLGLSIVKKLAEIAGATVTCRSVPGAGATFVVSLPRCPDLAK